MANVAQNVIWPKSEDNVLVRVVFLYVGQGASAVVIVADGDDYKTLLVDANVDVSAGGIDVPRLMDDLLDGGDLHAFVNTHPHNDHLESCLALSEKVNIKEVWHSGHVPSKKYGEAYYGEFKKVLDKVKKKQGDEAEILLEGSRSATTLGDAEYYVLGPAEHVTDDVNEEEALARYQRIHEMCAVLKFGLGDQWIMIAGDADHIAFEQHITDYHKKRLPAYALGGSHHGSRTFFMAKEGDEPYLDALNAINPEYVVLSAPTQEESSHDHPHDDAWALYEKHVGKENVLHTGEERKCFIFDILRDGTHAEPRDDDGALAEEYGLSDDDDDGGSKAKAANEASGPFVPPESGGGDQQPRRYASRLA